MAVEYGAMNGSTVVGKGYRLATFSIYCRRKCLSIGQLTNVSAGQNFAEAPRLKDTVTDNGYR